MEYKNGKFLVAASCFTAQKYDDTGYIEYDPETKSVQIFLKNKAAIEKAMEYLHQPQTMQIPHHTMNDFTTITIEPLANVDNFQLALTRLWEYSNVYIDWSRPVDYVIAHMNEPIE